MRRSRAANVVTSSRDSDDEHDQEDLEDSEDDWKPEKKKDAAAAKGKRKSTASAATPKGRGKRSKKDKSEEDSEEEEDDEEEDLDSDESDEESGKVEKRSGTAKKPRMSIGENQPDKDGKMKLHMFKNDLTKEFRNDEKLCMWRRDGASLLQKYMVVSNKSRSGDIVFKASSVYSCWEEKRKSDFFQFIVQLIGDKKDGKVKVVDIAEFERLACEDRPKVDITPKGAEGGENYEEGSEEEYEEDEE